MHEDDHRSRLFEGLVAQYQAKVFHLVLSLVRNTGRAEEVTQDVFLKLWLALPKYDGRASIATWLYTIARNTGLSHLRSERYRRTEPLEMAPEPPAEAAWRLESLDVDRLLRGLPEELRMVVELFYFQDRSLQDVADMLGMPEGTVKSHLFRARRAMARMMEGKS